MKRNIQNKWCPTQFPTTSWPVSSQFPSSGPGQLPPSLHTDHVSYHTECPFGHLGSAVPAETSPSFLWFPGSLVGWEKELQSPQLRASTAQQQLKLCAINILLILNPKPAMYQRLEGKLTLSQPKPGHSRKGKDVVKRSEQQKNRRKSRRDWKKHTAMDQQKKERMWKRQWNTVQKLDAGFSKIFLQSPHGCKPLMCSSLVRDTYCKWEHLEEPVSHTILHAAPWSLCTAMKNCCWVEEN